MEGVEINSDACLTKGQTLEKQHNALRAQTRDAPTERQVNSTDTTGKLEGRPQTIVGTIPLTAVERD